MCQLPDLLRHGGKAPARAASIEAFSDRRLVCEEMSSISWLITMILILP